MATDDNVTSHRPLHLTFIDMMTIGGVHLHFPAIHIIISNGDICSTTEKAVAVAEKMIELGLSVHEDGKIYCGNLKISDKALATAANVDRRAIKSTIEVINEDSELFDLFNNIIPAGTLLKNIAKIVDLGVIEIEVGSDNEGVLAAATNLITNNGINIRQAYAEDSELQKYPILTVITNEPINGELINEFLKIKGVNRVSIY